MKIKTTLIIIIILSSIWINLFAQPGQNRPFSGRAAIIGRVVNPQDGQPVEYANIVLYREQDSSLVMGTITDAGGRFTLADLPPGKYYLEISFIGFRANRVHRIELSPDARLDLGKINLEPTAIAMPEVEATAEKPKLEFKIDRKVINVDQNPALQTGTAVDVLKNAPSVKVDLEGNVTLRGLSSFTVLIDGRPTALEGGEALRQVPASTIDRIEIVTNPSAKYEPEGKAGIINVILKKQRQPGISGIFTLNAGNNSQAGTNLLLSLKTNTATFYLNPYLSQGNFPGTWMMKSWTITSNGDTAYRTSSGTMLNTHRFYGFRAGAELQLTKNDWLSFSARLGKNQTRRVLQGDYYEWNSPATTPDTLKYPGVTSSFRSGTHLFVNLDIGHNFGKKGHELQLHASLGPSLNQESTQTEDSVANILTRGQLTSQTRQAVPFNFKLDYTLPLREKDKFEAGYQPRLRFGPNEKIIAAKFDTATGTYHQDTLQYLSNQRDDVHAFYSTYSANWQGFGAMLGLRTEYSGRTITINDTTFTPLNRWDFFPSLHLSYSFPKEQQIMASYTRRIDRPRGWYLSPYLTWLDSKNVSQGNPGLKPEYIDSYELGFLLPFGFGRFSIDGYYRKTHNVIERFQSIYQEDIMLHTVNNIGSDRARGVEANLNLSPFRWWNITVNGELYDYQLNSKLDTIPITRHSTNWRTDISTDFSLPTLTQIQLSAQYQSPSPTAQGREGARITTSISARQLFLNRQLIVALSIRDPLAGNYHEVENQTDRFYTLAKFTPVTATFSLGLTYNFNNYRPERRRQQSFEEEETTRPIYEY